MILIDSSEESDTQQEPDAVATQEKTTCSSISVDAVDRREESEDFEESCGDVELSVSQVSAYSSDVEEGCSIVNNVSAQRMEDRVAELPALIG